MKYYYMVLEVDDYSHLKGKRYCATAYVNIDEEIIALRTSRIVLFYSEITEEQFNNLRKHGI